MIPQPRGQGLALPIGQQLDPTPALEITQDRAVVAALAPGPVIDPEHTRRERRIEIADAAQQGRRAMPIRLAMCAPGLPPVTGRWRGERTAGGRYGGGRGGERSAGAPPTGGGGPGHL